MFNPNPPRRCGGSKKPNSFYLEGGEFSDTGTLWPWVWLLGDGIEDNIYLEIPPRQMQLINPVLTILFQTFMPMGGPKVPIPKDRRWVYDHLHNGTSVPGVADHVGAQFYTPFNFALETQELSASRRVSSQMARALSLAINQYGPMPMMFTHSDIPSFRNVAERGVALAHVKECMGYINGDDDHVVFMQPTWKHDNWGMYASRKQWIGHTQFMVPVLRFMDAIKCNWKELKDQDCWVNARKYFRGLRYTEQTFGMSWLCQVTYTMPAGGETPDKETMKILEGMSNVNVIDLENLDEQAKVFEVENE